jgi:hypothetical protein
MEESLKGTEALFFTQPCADLPFLPVVRLFTLAKNKIYPETNTNPPTGRLAV